MSKVPGGKKIWFALVVMLMLAGLAGTPAVTWAHARVASSTPANGEIVAAGLTEIIINFTEDVSIDQSDASVSTGEGAPVAATPSVSRANRKEMTIALAAPLTEGDYIVRWHVVTEDDNGITDGNINFTVGGAASNCTTFDETGRTVCGRFLEYWEANGGLAQQGYPISGELQEVSETDGNTYTVQYFERAVFEMHPENAAPNDVLLSLLGNFLYQAKYPDGAPGQQASASNPVVFPETGKTLGGKFREYWEANGGLAQQGYPISDEFTEVSDLNGQTYLVQYFERAVFEYHPENAAPFDVLLSQLGTFQYREKYGEGTGGTEMNVDIVDFAFSPQVIEISAGTRVTWTQVGPTEHNTVEKVVRPNQTALWESDIMRTVGETYSYTFTAPGTFDYWCTIHPDMVGTVIVK